jgi:lysozyme family protein
MIDDKIKTQLATDIIKAEGGYTNDPTDRGGATNFGITLATLKTQPGFSAATSEDIKNLSSEEARAIYYETYLAPFDELHNIVIFKFLVNTAVQHGIGGAAKVIQLALGITVDGKFGPDTKAKLQAAEIDTTTLLSKLVAARLRYYTAIVKSNPSQSKFICGWVNRVALDLL